MSSVIAAANASGSPGGTRRPVTPSRTPVGDRADIACDDRPAACHRLEHDVGEPVPVPGGVNDRGHHDQVGGGVAVRERVVGPRWLDRHSFVEPEPVRLRDEITLQRTLADQTQQEVALDLRDGREQRVEALLLHEPAHGQHHHGIGRRRRGGRERREVHAVADQPRPRSDRGDCRRDVVVAGQDDRRTRGAAAQLLRGDLPRIEGVDAEPVRNAEQPRGHRRDLGGTVRKVAVHRRHPGLRQGSGDLGCLARDGAVTEHRHRGPQLGDRRMADPGLPRLRREDARQHFRPVQCQELVERERLGQPRPPGYDDRHPCSWTSAVLPGRGVTGARHEDPPAGVGCPARRARTRPPPRSRTRRGR